MQPLTYALRMASPIIKRTTSSALFRSTLPIMSASPQSSFYHTPSRTASTLELNDELVNLVRHAQYDDAFRLRNHLVENKIHINHHLIYEKAALAGVDLGETKKGLEKFIIWFSLVPDRNELPSSLNQPQQIYSDTHFSLLHCGNPKRHLKYIMVFGSIMAAKGYVTVSFLEIAQPIVRFARKELVTSYFKELEEATVYYYWEQEPEEGGRVLKWFWEVVVRLYVEKGWLGLAFETMAEKHAEARLSDELRNILLREFQKLGFQQKRRWQKRASVLQVLSARVDKEAST